MNEEMFQNSFVKVFHSENLNESGQVIQKVFQNSHCPSVFK